jgi:hypothetical protein
MILFLGPVEVTVTSALWRKSHLTTKAALVLCTVWSRMRNATQPCLLNHFAEAMTMVKLGIQSVIVPAV